MNKVILVDKNEKLIARIKKEIPDLEAVVGDVFKEAKKYNAYIATASNPSFSMEGGLDGEIAKRFPKEIKYIKEHCLTEHLFPIVSVDANLKSTKEILTRALVQVFYANYVDRPVVLTCIGTGIGGYHEDDFISLLKDVFGDGRGNKVVMGDCCELGDSFIRHPAMRGSSEMLRKIGKICESKNPTVKDFWKVYSGESTMIKKDGSVKGISCYVFFKAVRDDRTTRGGLVFKDKTWVKDTEPFDLVGSCVSGGIYFSGLDFVLNFNSDYKTILKVAVPINSKEFVIDPAGDKCRASEIYVMGEYGEC